MGHYNFLSHKTLRIHNYGWGINSIMKKLKNITLITILLCLVVFILTILDFAALHDIKHDYVSRHILNYFKIDLSGDLPDWTSTKGEWHIVSLSLYLRFIFFILNTAVLIYYLKRLTTNKKGS